MRLNETLSEEIFRQQTVVSLLYREYYHVTTQFRIYLYTMKSTRSLAIFFIIRLTQHDFEERRYI